MLHKVNITGLTMDPTSNTPIIILKTEDDEQAVPIWIGLLEATSIASALQNIKYERPMTMICSRTSVNRVPSQGRSLRPADNAFCRILVARTELYMDARPSDTVPWRCVFRHRSTWMIRSSSILNRRECVADTSEEGKSGRIISINCRRKISENTKFEVTCLALSEITLAAFAYFVVPSPPS
jgi:hypothetical protein